MPISAHSAAGLDLEHVTAVCDDAAHTTNPGTAHIHAYIASTVIYVAMPSDQDNRAALHALRRVGYLADGSDRTEPQMPLVRWICVAGWDNDALTRRLDGLAATIHQLTRDLPVNGAHAIDTYTTINDLPDLDAPKYRAAAQLRTQLRAQVTATSGPHVPYNPDLVPVDSELARLLDRARTAEYRVDDLISRTWLTATEAIERFTDLRHRYAPALARACALTEALNPTLELAQRDTVITVMEWARGRQHGDAIPYAHWYAETHGTCEDGPDPADAYETWRHQTARSEFGQHPAALAAHDTPYDEAVTRNATHAIEPRNDDRTYNRNNAVPGRRAS